MFQPLPTKRIAVPPRNAFAQQLWVPQLTTSLDRTNYSSRLETDHGIYIFPGIQEQLGNKSTVVV